MFFNFSNIVSALFAYSVGSLVAPKIKEKFIAPPDTAGPSVAMAKDGSSRWREQTEEAIKLPIYAVKRKLRVVCIGAGISGIFVAYKVKRHFDDFELNVFEKNEGVSGTWWENRYPGCACDVPAHIYTFSFEPNYHWSSMYATAPEVCKYYTDFAHKYDVNQYIKLRHEVISAIWDASASLWTVSVKNLSTGEVFEQKAEILINASGILNNWKWPQIEGLKDFKGELVHTAAWKEGLSLKGKRVGVIGNGSTGVQIIPAILPEVASLTSFIRGATWISGPFATPQAPYSETDIANFLAKPESLRELRCALEKGMNTQYGLFFNETEFQKMCQDYTVGLMKEKLAGTKWEEELIPKFPLGCRRVTPGMNYLESLSDPKMELVTEGIARVTPSGIVTRDGKEFELDVLIAATGFDTSFKPRFPIVGKEGVNLVDKWKVEPKSYCGLAAADMPNYFMTLGPNCPIGNGPVIIAIEKQVEYMISMMSKFQKENIKSFSVRPEAIDEFVAFKDQYMEKMVWTRDCSSWYKNGTKDGKVVALWPGSTMHYIESIETPRYEDWEVERYGNRWDYLGNGFSTAETKTMDHTFYIGETDISRVDPVLKSRL